MNNILANKWVLAVGSGILMSLAFPPFDIVVGIFLGFGIVLHLAHSANNHRLAALHTYVAFVVWNLITTYWLMFASLAAGVAAIFANALLMVIPVILFRVLLTRFSSIALISILQASAWVGYEFLHHRWDLSWPWLTLGYTFSNFPDLVQYSEVTGIFGISFWIILVSSLAYFAWKQSSRNAAIASVFALFLFPFLSFLMIPNHAAINGGQRTEVVIVQPNFDSYFDFGGLPSQEDALNVLLSLSDSAKTSNSTLIIWPENAIDSNLTGNDRHTRRIIDSTRAWNIPVMTGTGYKKLYTNPLETPSIHRTQNGVNYNIFNSAMLAKPKLSPQFYEKRNLVPVVERLPFAEFFQKLDFFGWVDWGKKTGFGKGNTADVFEVDKNIQSPSLICYDSVFPEWIRQTINNKATFLSIITNDGWWGDTSGHHQHFAYARLRAIEFRRWIARSANNGISGVIAPDGSIHKKTQYWERTAFSHDIGLSNELTFYARYGDWIGILSLILALGAVAIARFPRVNSNESQSEN